MRKPQRPQNQMIFFIWCTKNVDAPRKDNFSPKKSWTSKKRCPCFHSIPIILAKLHHLKYCPSTSSTSDHFSNVLSLELFTVTRLLYTRRESSTKIKSSGLKKKEREAFFFFYLWSKLFQYKLFQIIIQFGSHNPNLKRRLRRHFLCRFSPLSMLHNWNAIWLWWLVLKIKITFGI